MKLFAVRNLYSGSEFDLQDDFNPDENHSGGAVILAESLEQAKSILLGSGGSGTLVEVPMDKIGIVLFANGTC